MRPIFQFHRIFTLASAVVFVGLLASPSLRAESEETWDFSAFLPKEKKVEATATPVRPLKCKHCSEMSRANDNLEALKEVATSSSGRVTKKSAASKNHSRLARILPDEVDDVSPPGPNPDENTWKQFPKIAAYSASSGVRAAIQYALSKKHRVSMGSCYKFVKDAIYYAGKLTSKRLDGTPVFPELPSAARRKIGQNAIKTLKAEHFINLLDDPETKALIKNPASAPKGAILIYEGGGNGGHIEIKTDFGARGTYVSDFANRDSVLGNQLAGRTSAHYKLVGVMVKEMEPTTQISAWKHQ